MSKNSVDALAGAVLAGDRPALARAITLVESDRADHRDQAEVLLSALMSQTGGSRRVGITGVPGVGKSTFIEVLGLQAIAAGHRVAVLTVDPSSVISGGSILGDKTRMPELSTQPAAFIRPSPAGTSEGGVARRTREALYLCEAAGFDLVIVETVGVGQSELRVAEMTDFFLLLLLPSGGDELQGIKRGVMELADLILVNKADGDLRNAANRTVAEYRQATGLLQPRTPGWEVPVQAVSALAQEGIVEVLTLIERCWQGMRENGTLDLRRAEQARQWLRQELREELLERFMVDSSSQRQLARAEDDVAAARVPATVAARRLLTFFAGNSEKKT